VMMRMQHLQQNSQYLSVRSQTGEAHCDETRTLNAGGCQLREGTPLPINVFTPQNEFK
jgi:hypothetical protein